MAQEQLEEIAYLLRNRQPNGQNLENLQVSVHGVGQLATYER
jgi:hypothetical protein